MSDDWLPLGSSLCLFAICDVPTVIIFLSVRKKLSVMLLQTFSSLGHQVTIRCKRVGFENLKTSNLYNGRNELFLSISYSFLRHLYQGIMRVKRRGIQILQIPECSIRTLWWETVSFCGFLGISLKYVCFRHLSELRGKTGFSVSSVILDHNKMTKPKKFLSIEVRVFICLY